MWKEWLILDLVRRGVGAMLVWVKPDFKEVGVNAECTAYSGRR